MSCSFTRSAGKRMTQPRRRSLPDTIYDAASLTKAVVTTTLVAMQVEAGRLGARLARGALHSRME